MAFDRRAELREISEMRSEQVRDENDRRAADAYEERRAGAGTGYCPPGDHRMVPTRNGGGVCVECGFPVDRDEL